MRARLGLETLESSVDDASRLVSRATRVVRIRRTHCCRSCWCSSVSVRTGSGTWTVGSETSATAASLGRYRNLPVLAAVAASHLAFTEYMAGRERTCVQVAADALETLHPQPSRTPFAEARAHWPPYSARSPTSRVRQPPRSRSARNPPCARGRPASRFLAETRDARLELIAHSVAGAEQVLPRACSCRFGGTASTAPGRGPPGRKGIPRCPPPLGPGQVGVEAELQALAADGEAALVAGLRDDLAGDRRTAAQNFAVAASATANSPPAGRSPWPAVRRSWRSAGRARGGAQPAP